MLTVQHFANYWNDYCCIVFHSQWSTAIFCATLRFCSFSKLIVSPRKNKIFLHQKPWLV